VSLAFQALAIFALALPGIILKTTYRNGFFWDRPRQSVAITEEVAYSLVLACALHAAFAPIAIRYFWPIDFQSIAMLLVGQYGPPVIRSMTVHPMRVFSYFVSLYAISAALGYGAHAVVRGLRLDRTTRWLRFDHQWHYLLRGEIAEFPDSDIKVPHFELISVASVVDTAAGSLLYVGMLDRFYFNKAGELDLLVLTGAMRRPILPVSELQEKPDYFFIDAEYLYLKYSEIRNVSIRYITLPDAA
jgi:hypothetical protein